MEDKYPYDGVVMFSTPLKLLDGDGILKNVYGSLFSTSKLNEFTEKYRCNGYPPQRVLDKYITHLITYHNFLKNGGEFTEDGNMINRWKERFSISPETWEILPYIMDVEYEVLIYKQEPIEIKEGETHEDWVLDENLITRLKKKINRQ